MEREHGWSAVRRGCATVVLTVACTVPVAWAQGAASQAAGTHVAADTIPLAQTIGTLLADPKIAGAHWGISVTQMDGSPVYALNDGQLFQPASNVKLFTTAAALGLLGPTQFFTTEVTAFGVLSDREHFKGNLSLSGHGDANLSGRAIPYIPNGGEENPPLRYLEEMADQIAKTGVKVIDGDIVGFSAFPNQPYGEGWNVDDLPWGYGAPVSGLSVNDNQLKLTITPSHVLNGHAQLDLSPQIPYYTIENDVLTGEARSNTAIYIERAPGAKLVRLYGNIALKAEPDIEHISIDDPAEFAAIALKQLLEQRGITITGSAREIHNTVTDPRSLREISHLPLYLLGMKTGLSAIREDSRLCPMPCAPSTSPQHILLARHNSPSLLDDVIVTNKVSQNLHAEIMLRQLGFWSTMVGSFAQGARVVRQFAIDAGVKGDDFYFVDGSGLSTYDLAAPRAFTQLLRYAATQTWGADWKSSLPVGGVDGSLEHRFTEAPLKGKVFAKTGTLSEDRALSGYLVCASGKTVVFSILVGNHLPGSHADRDAMDKIVAAVAAAN